MNSTPSPSLNELKSRLSEISAIKQNLNNEEYRIYGQMIRKCEHLYLYTTSEFGGYPFRSTDYAICKECGLSVCGTGTGASRHPLIDFTKSEVLHTSSLRGIFRSISIDPVAHYALLYPKRFTENYLRKIILETTPFTVEEVMSAHNPHYVVGSTLIDSYEEFKEHYYS